MTGSPAARYHALRDLEAHVRRVRRFSAAVGDVGQVAYLDAFQEQLTDWIGALDAYPARVRPPADRPRSPRARRVGA